MVHGRDLKTSALTSAALQARKRAGKRTGTVPYGYSALPDGMLVQNEAEQANIVEIRKLRSYGMSLRNIESVLARTGVVSRTGRPLILQQIFRIARAGA